MTTMPDGGVTAQAVTLNPVRGKDRIVVLDMLRGIAILGILFINLPFMAGPLAASLGDIRAMGWAPADQTTWVWLNVVGEGTQRALLEFLFGAGLMVTAAKAMEPDGPVAVADLYIRRNLWLLLFGLLDVFALLWPGDILHVYALCALALFPFRKLKVRWLIVLGLSFAMVTGIGGALQYVSRGGTLETAAQAEVKQSQGQKLTSEEQDAVKEVKELHDRIAGKEPVVVQLAKDEAKGRSGSMLDYASFWWSTYVLIVGKGSLLGGVFEAFSTMLLGIALWKLGVIQGQRSTRDYVIMLVLAYGFGLTARYIGCGERLLFQPQPKTLWFTAEFARLAVALGHVALVNLLVRATAGARLLAPFKAAGQMAFSLYFLEQFIGLYVMFSPIGLHLPGGQGWAHVTLQAFGIVVGLLIFANLWMRWFASGPLEWVWRSLTYGQRQPFRRRA